MGLLSAADARVMQRLRAQHNRAWAGLVFARRTVFPSTSDQRRSTTLPFRHPVSGNNPTIAACRRALPSPPMSIQRRVPTVDLCSRQETSRLRAPIALYAAGGVDVEVTVPDRGIQNLPLVRQGTIRSARCNPAITAEPRVYYRAVDAVDAVECARVGSSRVLRALSLSMRLRVDGSQRSGRPSFSPSAPHRRPRRYRAP